MNQFPPLQKDLMFVVSVDPSLVDKEKFFIGIYSWIEGDLEQLTSIKNFEELIRFFENDEVEIESLAEL